MKYLGLGLIGLAALLCVGFTAVWLLAPKAPDFAALRQDDPLFAKGEALFERCSFCHSITEDDNRAGPHLAGVFGREAGTACCFIYSPVFKDLGFTWDEQTLDAYIGDNQGFIANNWMNIPEIPDAEERKALIHYLKHL